MEKGTLIGKRVGIVEKGSLIGRRVGIIEIASWLDHYYHNWKSKGQLSFE